MAKAAAEQAADLLKGAIARKERAAFVAATGVSQFGFLGVLVSAPGIDWAKTTLFHLNEYAGLPEIHPASFRRYLKERLIERVHPGEVHLIQGDAPDLQAECRRLNRLIAGYEIAAASLLS
jgi:glucosamine-6-phosphate deaminase